MLDRRLPRQDDVERGNELVCDGAAQASVRKLDDVLLRTGRVAAALEDLAVDAEIAKLVDDHREPSPLRMRQHMADERGLARSQKAGDDRAWHPRERAGHDTSS